MHGARARYGRRHVPDIQRTSTETNSITVRTTFLLYILYIATCFGIHIVQIQKIKQFYFKSYKLYKKCKVHPRTGHEGPDGE